MGRMPVCNQQHFHEDCNTYCSVLEREREREREREILNKFRFFRLFELTQQWLSVGGMYFMTASARSS